MKAPIRFIAATIVLVTLLSSFAKVAPKADVVTIQTSAVCESCKARIEKALKKTDGVIEANLNLDNKKIKVKFNPEKINADQIRTVIANTGYDADGVKKNTEAYGKLPHCCQNGGKSCEHKE